jgi:head-tail adaptor
MSVISAGQLRHRVTVYTASTSVDAFGQRQQALAIGPTIYAEVRATGASETNYGDGAAMRTQYQIRTRWRTGTNAGIDATCQLEYRGDRLQVQGLVREREEEDVMLIDAVRIA